MSIEAAKQRLIEAKKQVDVALIELEQAEKADSDPRWKPKKGESYWHIDGFGDAVTNEYVCDNRFFMTKFDTGSIYQTREQAEKHAKRLRVFNLSWALADAMGGGNREITLRGGAVISLNNGGDTFCSPAFPDEGVGKAIKLIGADKIKDAWSND